MAESICYGVLDSACTKTVAGELWMQEYLASLTDEERSTLESSQKKSLSTYRFGDGVESKSLECFNVPIIIGKEKVSIEVDVVENKIPLLISKPIMTKLGMKLDFENHEVTVGDQTMKLNTTSSGHCLPISYMTKQECNVTLNAERVIGSTLEEKKRKALKLHRQMCHASSERLQRLLKNAGCVDKEFGKEINNVCENCDFCRKYKRPYSKPVVGFPVAEEFNQIVCIDLKEVRKGALWIVHMIDAATRYTAASLIQSKNKDLVVSHIFQIWIAYFGAPKKFHSDCGGEFCNDVFREMNEKLGIETSTTPVESPFSNGIVERHNKVLYESMMKTMEEMKCDMEIALAWSVSAKNCLQNVSGYSPNQLLTGLNVNLPSILTDKLPAHETPQSETVRKKLLALHSARKNFIAAVSNERIKCALRHPVRTYSEQWYEPGEKVYYKRKNYKGWKGPAKVLAKEGNFVLIRHGNAFYRCHPMKVHSQSASDSSRNTSEVGPIKRCEPQANGNGVYQKNQSNDSNDDDEDDSVVQKETDGELQMMPLDEARTTERNADDDVENKDDAQGAELMESKLDKPKRRTMIEYLLEDGTQSQGTVMNIQPKKNSTYRDWVNIQDVEGNKGSVNWPDIQWWRKKESEQVLLLNNHEVFDPRLDEATEKEMNNLEENHVFEWVEDSGQKRVSTRLVISEKIKDKGESILKARLVARGYEEDKSGMHTDSSTCTKQSLRIVVASTFYWELHSIDSLYPTTCRSVRTWKDMAIEKMYLWAL